jgi:hypothetical protein
VGIQHGRQLFHVQNKITKITSGPKRKVSYRDMIRKFNFLPFTSAYLCTTVTCKPGKNSYTYSVGRRHRCDLHVPNTDFNKHQKQFHYTGTKLFSNYTSTEHSIISFLLCTRICPLKKFSLIMKHVCKNDELCDVIIFWSDCK